MKIIEKFKDKINGVLSAFDRMIIKGHIRQLFSYACKASIVVSLWDTGVCEWQGISIETIG